MKLKTVLVPKENADDIAEILQETELGLNIVYVESMDEVLKYALQNDPFIKKEKNNKNGKKTSKKKAAPKKEKSKKKKNTQE